MDTAVLAAQIAGRFAPVSPRGKSRICYHPWCLTVHWLARAPHSTLWSATRSHAHHAVLVGALPWWFLRRLAYGYALYGVLVGHRLAYVEITRAEHPPARREVHGCGDSCVSQTTGRTSRGGDPEGLHALVGPALTNAQSDTMGDDKCGDAPR